MEFKKYTDRGGYHWREYVRGTKYRKHADHIKNWVKEKNVLDIGAGDGVITYLVRAIGIDNEPDAVRIAQAVGVDVQLGDAYALPYPDNAFNAAMMIDVLEHFDAPERALQEARRVAPVLYIATPERQPDRKVRDKYHVQEWTRTELVDLMSKNGYTLSGDILVVPEGDTMYGRFNSTIHNA